MCDTRLDCGHQCTKPCHVSKDPDHKLYKCRKPCAKECPEGHPCKSNHQCFEECGACAEKIDRKLPCGHVCNLRCSTDLKYVRCQKPCERTVVDCVEKHPCPKKCFETCSPCIVSWWLIIP